uniref:Uncharacterized protein n=1 Tax=Musca domestica TaxID=7370 RepID=A0A1I8NIQ7_MUSDO
MNHLEVQNVTVSSIIYYHAIKSEGAPLLLRATIRKVFSDNIACQYSWKRTSLKPNAEKCYLVTTCKYFISDICHLKYTINDKDINTILQKHFVHARGRVTKRKRPDCSS